MNTRTMVAALLGIIGGLTMGCLGMYLFLIQPFTTTWTHSGYNSAVAEAKLAAAELQLLRDGDTPKLIATLEGVLDAHLLNVAALEEAEPTLRDHQAEEAVSSVRQYRLRYPSAGGKDIQDKVMRVLQPKIHAPAAH